MAYEQKRVGYGVKPRQQHAYYKTLAKKSYPCVKCLGKISRTKPGVWSCNKCKLCMVGNAYTPN